MLAPIPAGRARDHFTRTNISLSYSAIGLRDRGWQMLRRLTKMKRKSLRGSLCPVARALDVIGDWWSLLIIYEVIAGPKRFGELQRNLGVTKNTLATNEDDFNRRIDAPGADPAKKRGIYLSLETRLASVPDGPTRAERTYPTLARSNHAKLDQNNRVAGSARQSRNNCVDRRNCDILCWARKHDRAPVADERHAIDRRRAGWPPPTACTGRFIGERQRSRAYQRGGRRD
jgi:hypothetical protein